MSVETETPPVGNPPKFPTVTVMQPTQQFDRNVYAVHYQIQYVHQLDAAMSLHIVYSDPTDYEQIADIKSDFCTQESLVESLRADQPTSSWVFDDTPTLEDNNVVTKVSCAFETQAGAESSGEADESGYYRLECDENGKWLNTAQLPRCESDGTENMIPVDQCPVGYTPFNDGRMCCRGRVIEDPAMYSQPCLTTKSAQSDIIPCPWANGCTADGKPSSA